MVSDVERELSGRLKAGFRGSTENVLARQLQAVEPRAPAPLETQDIILGRLETLSTEEMIVRSTMRCAASRRLQVCCPRNLQCKPRRYSSSTSSLASSASNTSPASMLGAFTNELDRIAPKFQIQGSQIHILRSPAEFYESLKVRLSTYMYC